MIFAVKSLTTANVNAPSAGNQTSVNVPSDMIKQLAAEFQRYCAIHEKFYKNIGEYVIEHYLLKDRTEHIKALSWRIPHWLTLTDK